MIILSISIIYFQFHLGSDYIYRSDVVSDTVNLLFNGRVFRVIGEAEHLGLTAS